MSGPSKLVPQGPKFLWHSPRTLDLKYENGNAINNQIEGLPRDLLIKMNWQPISHRSATNLSTVLKTGGLRKYKVAL